MSFFRPFFQTRRQTRRASAESDLSEGWVLVHNAAAVDSKFSREFVLLDSHVAAGGVTGATGANVLIAGNGETIAADTPAPTVDKVIVFKVRNADPHVRCSSAYTTYVCEILGRDHLFTCRPCQVPPEVYRYAIRGREYFVSCPPDRSAPVIQRVVLGGREYLHWPRDAPELLASLDLAVLPFDVMEAVESCFRSTKSGDK